MQIQGRALRICVYIGEDNHYHGASLYMALLEFLKREGASGATVMRGVAGFGARSRIHTSTILTLSTDLPIIVEWVDTPERVAKLLPQVRRMVDDGLITQEEVTVVQYAPGRAPDPLVQPVFQAMRGDVLTVAPATPIADVISLLLQHGHRSLPVVDDKGHLCGIITDGDLLHRAQMFARLGLQSELTQEQLQHQLNSLRAQNGEAQDIMTQPVVTVNRTDTLRQAVQLMTEHNLKRLPVVDDDECLVGWLSRIDVMRAVEYHQIGEPGEGEAVKTGGTVRDLMVTRVSTVTPHARLDEVLHALEASRQRRAVVVDDEKHVVGIISDGDLLRRSRNAPDPNVLNRLRHLITGGNAGAVSLPLGDETAAMLMSSPVITVQIDSPLSLALGLMVRHGIKRLPVVDAEGRLLGLLGRASVLRGLLNPRDPEKH